MKKRKFAEGGEFKLSDEALAAGLRIGRNENIREEDRRAAIKNTDSIVDKYRDYDTHPEAEAIPVPAPRTTAPRATSPRVAAPTPRAAAPDMVSDQTSRNAPRPRLGNQNDYSMNAQEGSGNINYGGGAAARAPSRGDSSRNSPIGDAADAIGQLLRNLPHNRQLRRERAERERPLETMPMKKGGAVKASKRGDGIAQRGKTKGRML
jgi:hypothetical protein